VGRDISLGSSVRRDSGRSGSRAVRRGVGRVVRLVVGSTEDGLGSTTSLALGNVDLRSVLGVRWELANSLWHGSLRRVDGSLEALNRVNVNLLSILGDAPLEVLGQERNDLLLVHAKKAADGDESTERAGERDLTSNEHVVARHGIWGGENTHHTDEVLVLEPAGTGVRGRRSVEHVNVVRSVQRVARGLDVARVLVGVSSSGIDE
jgi:hypothetical protein